MINIQEKKNKIISFLEINGPSLPIRIAKAIEMEPFLASAIISELLETKQVKTSHIKIGASPLYLLPGQEQELERHTDNLKSIEKEAYLKLKENKIITEENEEPATRVALRKIKDFAIPFKFKDKIIWKYAFIPNEEAQKLIFFPKKESKIYFKNYFIYKTDERDRDEIYKNVKKLEDEYGNGFMHNRDLKIEERNQKDIAQILRDKIKEFSKTNPKMKFIIDYSYGMGKLMETEIEECKKYEFEIIELNKPEEETQDNENSKKIENIFKNKKEEYKLQIKPKTFLKQIEEFLENKNTKIISIEEVDKKKVIAKTESENKKSILFAFNKKRINEDEIIKCYKQAKLSKLPYHIIILGDITKKMNETINAYKKLTKIEKLKII